MDYNIKRNYFENHVFGTKLLNQNKSFQEKSMKKFQNKNIQINDDNKNNKIKNNYRTYDGEEVNVMKYNRVNLYRNIEPSSTKSFNGNKLIQNDSYEFDRKYIMNVKLNDYQRNASNELKLSLLKPKDNIDECKHHVYKLQESKNDLKQKNFRRIDSINGKIKWTFLQESQLNKDKYVGTSVSNNNELISSTNINQRSLNNGLNPSAVEFTPNTALSSGNFSTLEESTRLQQITETISTISNPVVIDTSDCSYTNPQLSLNPDQAYIEKLGLIDYHNMYQCRPFSRMNYENVIPQFRVLNCTNPQLIRYNPSHNIPINFQNSYIVYNSMIFNGMFNTTSPLLNNRLVSIGAADIPIGNSSTNIAHSFNPNVNFRNYSSSYYSDSSNNGPSHNR